MRQLFVVVLTPFRWLLELVFLPFYLIYRVFHDDQQKATVPGVFKSNASTVILRFVKVFLILTIILPAWVGAIFFGVFFTAYQLRYLEEPIPISGTGSMYPTFPKGEGKTPQELSKETVGAPGMLPYPNGLRFHGKRYFGHEIERGDIVVFINDTTKKLTKETYGDETGLVKRVIGLPGDIIEIKDGILYVNHDAQKESYVAEARSTFGGTFLPDCSTITVPNHKLFVLGDNRKGSSDSRHDVGFVDYSDVTHALPYKKQLGLYDAKWHDPSHDLDDSAKIQLDNRGFVALLNKKRQEKGLKPLTLDAKLSKSAALRGKVILKYNDFSFEATKSGYTMEKSMADAGYSNIVWGEAPILGYYEAEELIENIFSFPSSSQFFLQDKYQDIGIAEVEGNLNGCPTQVVVEEVGGYVPPNYKPEQVQSWRALLATLKENQKNWADLRSNYISFYNQNKADIDRINDLFATRISHVEGIVQKMESNQWLSKEETDYTYQDERYNDELNSLVKKINDKSRQQ